MTSKLAFILFIMISFSAFGQIECNKYGADYIPVDLNDALDYFDCLWSEESQISFKNQEEKQAVGRIHLETGMAIRNSWGFWRGDTEIAKYFHNLGINHPDDMSGIVLTSMHRRLNNKDLALQEQIDYYKAYWAEAEKIEAESSRNEFKEYKIGEKVEFTNDYDFISKSQERKADSYKCIAHGVVMGLDSVELKLKIRLIESCDKKGIIISKVDVYNKVDDSWVIGEKDKIEIMKMGDVRWTPYHLWEMME